MMTDPIKNARFWLGDHPDLDFSGPVGLVRLSSMRRSISNFVYILTGKQIPVRFDENGQSRTDGKVVVIGSSLSKGLIDLTVGTVLHESMHIVESDFIFIKTLWGKIPTSIRDLGTEAGLNQKQIAELVKLILNVVEDFYIDARAKEICPGYAGYYAARYDYRCNREDVIQILRSSKLREKTWDAYKFRVINIDHPAADLDALPDLKEIYRLISPDDILRLRGFRDRVDVALEVSEVVLRNLKKDEEEEEEKETTASNEESDDTEESEESEGAKGTSDDTESDEEETESQKADEPTDEEVKEVIQRQEDQTNGKVEPMPLSKEDSKMLEDMEESEVKVVNVGGGGIPKVSCVVIQRVTNTILDSDIFPYKIAGKLMSAVVGKESDYIYEGIRLGIALGHKLQVRGESRVTKFSRQPSGKFDRKQVADLGYDSDSVFYRLTTDTYKRAHAHISVDASSSMEGDKWKTTMKTVLAIAKAATMVNNLDVTISLRSGNVIGESAERPYITIIYDSKKDKLSKLTSQLPKIYPAGSTPEGLAFQAILNLIPPSTDELTSFFINISDGQPGFGGAQTGYSGPVALMHTRRQVKIIQAMDVEVLSYFIETIEMNHADLMDNRRAFEVMYGRNAQFIDVSNVTQIAQTLNKRFLRKS